MRFFSDTAKYAGYVVRAAKSQLKAEVANSYLNWVWWILDPLCFMLIYAFIFGVVFDGREPYFAAFIFVGLTAWNFFNKCSISSVKMVKRNKAIIDKVYIPKYVLAYTRMGVDGFKMMISFAIIVCMMAVYRVHLTWNVVLVIPILALLLIITFAAMTILMHLGGYEQYRYDFIPSFVLCHRYFLFGIQKAAGALRRMGSAAESHGLYPGRPSQVPAVRGDPGYADFRRMDGDRPFGGGAGRENYLPL